MREDADKKAHRMEYDPSSIKVIDDPIALVRRRPEMFVGPGGVRPGFLATALAHDALDLGIKQVEIHHIGEWWVVASDEDWLGYHNDLGVRETFNRILPIPGSVNSCRSELVIHALAASVFTSKDEDLVILTGDGMTIRSLLAREPFSRMQQKRIVAFAMAQGEASKVRRTQSKGT